jgi:hypothetical protein
MAIICPYCEIEISEKMVEAEDGCCPECGTSITALSSGIEEEEEDIYAEEFENNLDDDDYESDYEDPFELDDDFFNDPLDDDDIPELKLRKNRLAVKLAEEEAMANDDVPELTLKSKKKPAVPSVEEPAPAPKKGKGKK